MKQASAQAASFYRRVARENCVWTLRDSGGFPAPMSDTGRRAQPFWSSAFRVLRMIRTVPAFAGYEPVRIEWPEFRDRWLPGLDRSGVLVGVNWSGPHAVGYDLDPIVVRTRVERAMQNRRRDGSPGPRAGGRAGRAVPEDAEQELVVADGRR